MGGNMKRRKFLVLSAGLLSAGRVLAADPKAPAVSEKDILKEGKPAAVANYCENPNKQPNKFCPTKPAGLCSDCMFYNKDNSKTTVKGKEVAKCQLLASAPSYVYSTASCATFVKRT
jgi:hypothetical protein